MRRTSITLSLLSLGLTCASAIARAREVPIQREALPVAVSAALQTRYSDAEILTLTQETEKGSILYEAEMTVAGRKIDALFDSNGTLREEEAEIPLVELPESVRAAHARSAQAKWKVLTVERVTSGNPATPVRFEMHVADGKRTLELQYSANGKRLKATRVNEPDREASKADRKS